MAKQAPVDKRFLTGGSIPLLAMAQSPLSSTPFHRGGLFSHIMMYVRCPAKGDPRSHFDKIQDRVGRHLEFGFLTISQLQMNIFASNLVCRLVAIQGLLWQNIYNF